LKADAVFQGGEDDLDALLAKFALDDKRQSTVEVEDDSAPPSARVYSSFTPVSPQQATPPPPFPPPSPLLGYAECMLAMIHVPAREFFFTSSNSTNPAPQVLHVMHCQGTPKANVIKGTHICADKILVEQQETGSCCVKKNSLMPLCILERHIWSLIRYSVHGNRP